MEFLENVAYTVLGGGIAAISGLVVQRWHASWERKNNIKKIRDLLKPEFVELYQILIDERRTVKKAKRRSEDDYGSLNEHEIEASQYLDRVGGVRLLSLAWDAIISSGNLIKLDNDEIEIIQAVQQSVRHYNKSMDQLQKEMEIQMKKEFDESPIINVLNLPNVTILEEYLDNYGHAVNEAINGFKELDNLSWFDNGKIKNTVPNRETPQHQD